MLVKVPPPEKTLLSKLIYEPYDIVLVVDFPTCKGTSGLVVPIPILPVTVKLPPVETLAITFKLPPIPISPPVNILLSVSISPDTVALPVIVVSPQI